MEYKIVDSKVSVDGREIFLGRGEDGEKILLEALDLSISGREIALIRDLRKAIQELPIFDDKDSSLIMYQGLLKIDGEFYLQIPYLNKVWDYWERNGEYSISPQKVLAAAQIMLKILAEFEDLGNNGFEGFFPRDLFLSGEDKWVMLDPRVRGLLSAYRAEDKLKKYFLPPEVIKGNLWNEKSYIYTIGLTLYYLGTGVFPYPLEQDERTATAIMKEKPLDPRYHKPEIGGSLALFILATLEKGTKNRPDLKQATNLINSLETSGVFRAKPEEEADFREEAAHKIRRLEKKRNLYWCWQKLKAPILITSIALVFLFMMTRGGGYQEVITPQTKPQEVVQYFYQAISEMNIQQLEETLKKGVGKEFDGLVTQINVISKVRLAYERLETPVLTIMDLRLSKHESTLENPVFSGEYTLKIIEGDHYLIQERKDRIVMGRIKSEWRIVSIDSQIMAERTEPLDSLPSAVNSDVNVD